MENCCIFAASNVKLNCSNKSCARHELRDKTMIKQILLSGLLTLALGISTMKAQDSYMSEANANDAVLVQLEKNKTSSTVKRTPNKIAVAFQMPYNGIKFGAGLRFSYDFTDVLRFSLDGNYYFYTSPNRRFRTITPSGEKGYDVWGRIIDINPNLNFVYGNGDFHFFVITGVYFSIGYSEVFTEIDDIEGAHGTYIDNKYYYYTDKLDYTLGLGVNVGCGIEYQINDNFRVFFDQQLALGIMTSWMAKLGCAFCL